MLRQQHAADHRPDDRTDASDRERPTDPGRPHVGRKEKAGNRRKRQLAADQKRADRKQHRQRDIPRADDLTQRHRQHRAAQKSNRHRHKRSAFADQGRDHQRAADGPQIEQHRTERGTARFHAVHVENGRHEANQETRQDHARQHADPQRQRGREPAAGKHAADYIQTARRRMLPCRHSFSMADGLRRNHEKHRDQREQSERAAHQEHERPTKAHHQRRGDRTAHHRAERKTDKHQDHQRRTALRRTALGGDRRHGRNGATHAEAADKPQRGQHRRRRGERTAERENAGDSERKQQHRPAAETIRQRPNDQRAQHRADKACSKHAAERCVIDLQRLREQRRDERQHQRVEAVDHRYREAHQRDTQHVADRRTRRRL
ncbi:hypothetical protein KCU90_g762, partial [Aureobasidium melanogenum]